MFPSQPNNSDCLVVQPFRYGVTLTTSGQTIFHLSTRDLLRNPQLTPTKGLSLYPTFVVYFIDYRRPIFLIQRTILAFFYKETKLFPNRKININLFLKKLFYMIGPPVKILFPLNLSYNNSDSEYNSLSTIGFSLKYLLHPKAYSAPNSSTISLIMTTCQS